MSIYKFLLLNIFLILYLIQFSEADWFGRGNSRKSSNYKDKFNRINKYLTENVETDDIEENLDGLNNFSLVIDGLNDNSKVKFDQTLIEPTKLLIKLLKLTTENNSYCNEENYNFFKYFENIYPKSFESILNSPIRKSIRIDILVKQVVLDVASDCSWSHPKELKKIIAKDKVTKERFDNVRQILDNVVEISDAPAMFLGNDLTAAQKAKGLFDLRSLEAAQAIYKAIKKYYRDDPLVKGIIVDLSNGKSIKKLRANEMLDKYLYKQCQFVVETLANIVNQSLYYNNLNGYLLEEIRDETKPLKVWIEYTRLCSRAIGEDNEFINSNILKVNQF